MTNGLKISAATLTLLLACGMAVGCSGASSAPFHMYSSPLLEGEMETPSSEARDYENGTRPGVEPRTVYVYQRWHSPGADSTPASATQYASNGSQSPPLDTVHPSSEPVLANYDADAAERASESVADGRATQQASAAETPAITDGEPAELSAQYMYAVLQVNGVDFDEEAATSIPTMYRECRAQGQVFDSERPNIGDLVFFHNTHDANDDGRNNDWYTQVGIIQDIATDGTVEFLAFFDGQVQPLRMNVDQLEKTEDATGRTINSQLRDESPDDPPYTQYRAGQLFAGYCDILGDRRELILIDEWP